MSRVLSWARPEIVALKPYEHAAWDPSLTRLHANESPWRAIADASVAGLNRYPEPQPRELVARLAELYGVAASCVLVGRGSDEGIDLLTRAFCRAGQDSIVICPPTFGMYGVAAKIQGANVVSVPLLAERGFALDVDGLLAKVDSSTRLVYLCTPNNPTANSLAASDVTRVLDALADRAIVVLDEAYVEFAQGASRAIELTQRPNLVILRTLSKAHGLAGARVGAVLAAPDVIALLRKIIPPYALTQLTIEAALAALAPAALTVSRERIAQILQQRARLAAALASSSLVTRVWPSETNFLLVEFSDADSAFATIQRAGLIVRDVRTQPGLQSALRITVGTPEQNTRLIASLR
jgi:histidinol-phosphate aminotransferase